MTYFVFEYTCLNFPQQYPLFYKLTLNYNTPFLLLFQTKKTLKEVTNNLSVFYIRYIHYYLIYFFLPSWLLPPHKAPYYHYH